MIALVVIAIQARGECNTPLNECALIELAKRNLRV